MIRAANVSGANHGAPASPHTIKPVDIIRRTMRLDPAEVLSGYRQGIFPMAYCNWPFFTWHDPPRRAVLPLDRFHLSRSLARTLAQRRFQVTFDQAFVPVMRACATRGTDGPASTWITEPLIDAYNTLHQAGHAHSVEVWVDGQLVGGTYGIHLGAAFFAESKFHSQRDMSKVALASLVHHLQRQNFTLLDVQYLTPHLAKFGVTEISRADYQSQLSAALAHPRSFSA